MSRRTMGNGNVVKRGADVIRETKDDDDGGRRGLCGQGYVSSDSGRKSSV